MDEPFAALDAITRNNLQRELHTIFEKKRRPRLFFYYSQYSRGNCARHKNIAYVEKNGEIVVDKKNPLPKPTRPSTEGYAALWEEFSQALERESRA